MSPKKRKSFLARAKKHIPKKPLREKQFIRYKDKRGRFAAFRRDKLLSVWVYDNKGRVVRQLMATGKYGDRIGEIDIITGKEHPTRAVAPMVGRSRKGWEPTDRIMNRMLIRDKEIAEFYDLELPFFIFPRQARFGKVMRTQFKSPITHRMETQERYLFAQEPVSLKKKVRILWVNVLIQWVYPGRRFLGKRNYQLIFRNPFRLKNLFSTRNMKLLENNLDAAIAASREVESTSNIILIQGISI